MRTVRFAPAVVGTQTGVETYPAVGASLGRLRRDVRSHAAEAGAEDRAGLIAQAASEAAANAIVHGYEGGDEGAAIEVAWCRDDGGLVLTVADRGKGFRPSRSSPGLGVGLALMAQIADELELREREGGGLVVWMRFVDA
jgi:anti-sigma regulatory factor (Ser/Thr protein kinase)